MSKQKLTIADLIAKKESLANKKKVTKDVYVEELGAVVTLEKPDRAIILESLEMENSTADDFLIYNCIVEPNLKDSELQKIYGCVEPVDIIEKIFDLGSIKGLAEHALSMAGFDSKVTAVDELKN